MDLAGDLNAAYVAKPVTIFPFTAVLLAPHRIGDPASLRAFSRPYRDVASRLTSWINHGHAEVDDSPGIHVHEYTADGITVRGIVAALDVSHRSQSREARGIWPHEAIHPEQATELAHRMAEMALNPAPILLAYRGTPDVQRWLNTATAGAPAWDFTDRAHQRHRIWAVRDRSALDEINARLADTDFLLADGHHRYAAYLELEATHPGTAWERGLVMLIDQLDTPLFLGAIHRLLHGTTLTEVLSAANGLNAEVATRSQDMALADLRPGHLLLTDGIEWSTVHPRLDHPAGVVGWLHDDLLPSLPNLATISHQHHLDGALAGTSEQDVAVILPTTDFGHVMASVQAGTLLPEKATSFQPKPSVGVLMRQVLDAPTARP